MKKYLGYIFVAVLLISTPFPSLARIDDVDIRVDQSQGSTQDSQGIGQSSQGSGQASQGVGKGFKLKNPLGDQTLMGFLQDLLEVIMIFAVPLIVFMIIYAGFLFVMDRGSNKTLEQAKRALFYAVIGGLLILGAWVILEVIQGTVDAFRA